MLLTENPDHYHHQDKKFATPIEWFEADELLQRAVVRRSNDTDNLLLRDGDDYEDDWLDANLHRLSRWEFSHEKWEVFISNHVRHNLVQSVLLENPCRILEIGGGTGAFARSLLRMYDTIATYTSIEQSAKVLEISRIANRKDGRFRAFVGSMEDSKGMRAAVAQATPDESCSTGACLAFHDIVVMSGSLCYVRNNYLVRVSLENALAELRIGGLLIASMLPRTRDAMRSCETMVPLSAIKHMSQMVHCEIVITDDMSKWGTGNQADRYLVVLRKTRDLSQPEG